MRLKVTDYQFDCGSDKGTKVVISFLLPIPPRHLDEVHSAINEILQVIQNGEVMLVNTEAGE